MGHIWVAGVPFEIDARVYRWDEGPRFNANVMACTGPEASKCAATGGILPFSPTAKNKSPRRFSTRPRLRSQGNSPTLRAAQAVINQFILHHDGCANAAMCFHVLHNERGLSCHFLLDNNGDLYQTLDLAFMAYHAGGFNTNSIGIELSNRGDTKLDPSYYAKKGVNRPVVGCRIHSHIYSTFDFTAAQYLTMKALAKALTRALPNLPLEYPQIAPGQQAWGELPGVLGYAGYLGHYHTTTRKWDPGPFDFKKYIKDVRGSMCFPIFPVKSDNKDPGLIPAVPADIDQIKALADKLYAKNEGEADGGFFPVGPFTGDSQLWHGGIHFAGELRQRVFAPFPGRLVAARLGPDRGTAGSNNFVLLRHDMSVGKRRMKFYTLYYHLFDETRTDPGADADGAPEWLASDGWKSHGKPGEVVLLEEPIEAGKVIGRMGLAGPAEVARAQLHFETFSEDDFMLELDLAGNAVMAAGWTFVDGTAGGRFCDDATIRKIIDRDKDGALSSSELTSFYALPGRAELRSTYVLSQSEWTADPDWKAALRLRLDTKVLDEAQLGEMIDGQITPGLFWTEDFADALDLPSTGEVYHYHPITFLRWVNEEIAKAKDEEAADPSQGAGPPPGVTDDINDVAGDSFVDDAELVDSDEIDVPLEKLVDGFPSAGEL